MKIYQVDAFAAALFQGNPAAVIPLTEWLPDSVMQDIAMENNLAETAFIVPHPSSHYDYTIRWFTPTVEVELCGHATLAAAEVVFRYLLHPGNTVVFRSLYSGHLKVSKEGNKKLVLDFPADMPTLADTPTSQTIFKGLHITPTALYRGRHDYMVVLDDQTQVETLNPDFKLLAAVDSRGLVVTAPGKEADFVSRCFFPQSGIDEDPVTGSAHTMMIPFWAARLGKNKLSAIQLSRRRGYLDCTLAEDRVLIGGETHIYLEGEINL